MRNELLKYEKMIRNTKRKERECHKGSVRRNMHSIIKIKNFVEVEFTSIATELRRWR